MCGEFTRFACLTHNRVIGVSVAVFAHGTCHAFVVVLVGLIAGVAVAERARILAGGEVAVGLAGATHVVVNRCTCSNYSLVGQRTASTWCALRVPNDVFELAKFTCNTSVQFFYRITADWNCASVTIAAMCLVFATSCCSLWTWRTSQAPRIVTKRFGCTGRAESIALAILECACWT